ncbi:MAG TPA: hypothetical protein VH120_04100 [Gemmataceae bacterium]|nr:hypothetical protein [Gemmataceae bacterium]
MLGGMIGNPMTPQGLGQILGNPALGGIVKPMLGAVGMPGLMGLSNLALGGGRDIGNIMKGNIGGVNAGT